MSLKASVSREALDAYVRKTPLAGSVERVSAPEGSSIATFVQVAFADPALHAYVRVEIDGVAILPAAWPSTIAKAGQIVTLAFRPGDSDFFRAILQIAVIALSAWVAPMLGPVWGPIAAAGINIVGNLLINALVPLNQPTSQASSAEPFYAVTGARNTARPWNTVPLLFGQMRIVPTLMGQVIQETVGDETYLRIPLCLGVTPMAVSDWKIGETDLSTFEGVDIETRLTDDAPAHTLYTGDPSQASVGVQIDTSTTTRTTAADIDEIDITLLFPAGLGGYDSKNRKVSKSVSLTIEYRLTGSADAWSSARPTVSQANTAADAVGAPYRPNVFSVSSMLAYQAQLAALGSVLTGNVTISRADPGRGFQRSVRFAVPRGQYDIRISRTTATSTDPATLDTVQWQYLNSIKSEVDPFPNRSLATAVIRIKSGEKTNGVIEQLNCLAQALPPVFSSGALSDPSSASAASLTGATFSRNPAELALWAIRGPHSRSPKPDAEIDWPSWATFAQWCIDQGLHFDEYVEGKMGRWEMVRRILQAGFARPVKFMGRLGVVIDRPRAGEKPSQVFTTRNVRNFRGRKTFPKEVHAVRVPFANEDNGWQADEVTVYFPGYDAETATIYDTLQIPGKTNADEIRTVVNQYLRNSAYQTEGFEFDMDAESVTVARGAYVRLQHDGMATGLGSAKVASLQMSGSDVAGFTLDVGVTTTAGPTLGAMWRSVIDTGGVGSLEVSGEAAVTRDAGDSRIFTFSAPVTTANAPAVGDLVLIGETGMIALDCLVQDIAPAADRQASISLVAYAGERFVDAPTWPAHDPKTTIPLGNRPATPVQLSVTANQAEMTLVFEQPISPRGVTLTGFKTWVREKGTSDDQWTPRAPLGPEERVFVAPVGEPGTHYDLRVIAVGDDSGGLPVMSNPLDVLDVQAIDTPAAPAGCSAAFSTRTSTNGATQLVLTCDWTANENPDVIDMRIEMLVSTGPDVWAELGAGSPPLGKAEIHGLQVGRDYTLGFVNVSRRGARSARTVIAPVAAPDTLVATAAMTAYPGSPLDADFGAAIDAVADAEAAALAAAASEATASAQAAVATAQAGAATTSASAAAGSASSASTSAGNASTSETNAAASASTASTQATNAAASASTASTQASAAAGSASSASSSASVAAKYAANAPFPQNFIDGLWSNNDSAYDNTGAAYSSGYFTTNSDGVRVFTTAADQQDVICPLGTFVPLPGRTYKMRWRVRRIAAISDGRPSYHYPYVMCMLDDGSPNWVADAYSISNDGGSWTLNQWYTFEVSWLAPATISGKKISWARPRFHYNWDNGTGSDPSTARYEFGGFEFEDTTEASAANAAATSNASAIAAESAARASSEAALSASIAGNTANVATNASAIATINGAAAFWETIVSAGGGDLAAVRLKAGASGSYLELISTVLRLANVSNGSVIEVMRAISGEAYFSRPISSDGGGKRATIGPGYGVSGEEVVLWFGPDTTAPSSQSRTNGYFALGTDGKTYVQGGELQTMFATPSPTNQQVQGVRTGAGSVTTAAASIGSVLGGNGAYTYAWTYVSGDTFTINSPTSSSTTGTTSVTVGQTKVGVYKCTVTDTATNRTASVNFTFRGIENT